MQIKLLEKPNIVFEVYRWLTALQEGRSFCELKKSRETADAAEARILDGCFDSMIAFEKRFLARFHAEEDVLRHLFKKREEIGVPLVSYLLHDALCREKPAFTDDAESIRTQSKATFFANMYSLLLDRFPMPESDAAVESYAEFFNFISLLPVSSELKWELCSFYNSFEQVRDTVADLILEAGEIYVEEYETVKHHVEWFTANYKMTGMTEPLRFLSENYPEITPKEPDVLYIVPSVTAADSADYLMGYTGKTVCDFFYTGVLSLPLRQIAEKPFDEKELCRALRVLGDPSKFEILRQTAGKPVYGLQLSRSLGISTATVSHHVSQLSEQGLIREQREANRVYYRANTEQLLRLADQLNRIFREK
ncbi:MAG: winged helix-turn-helix transcriptional regulator [Clostridia bacterium]|nr:winged helix-turn-helix transcriptional regulator [Clostridia bacterium]